MSQYTVAYLRTRVVLLRNHLVRVINTGFEGIVVWVEAGSAVVINRLLYTANHFTQLVFIKFIAYPPRPPRPTWRSGPADCGGFRRKAFRDARKYDKPPSCACLRVLDQMRFNRLCKNCYCPPHVDHSQHATPEDSHEGPNL